ncbi:hypothetical protein D3C87_217100 [compost metagenome]
MKQYGYREKQMRNKLELDNEKDRTTSVFIGIIDGYEAVLIRSFFACNRRSSEQAVLKGRIYYTEIGLHIPKLNAGCYSESFHFFKPYSGKTWSTPEMIIRLNLKIASLL